ncbi:MAG: trigger factor [Woeseiaceae bacterium]
MLVSVEASGALERRMRVEVPAQQIDSQISERLKRVGKTARLEGFRPGKVPAKVIAKRYGPQVRQEVISEVVQSSYAEALQKENLMPAGNPNIEPEEMAEGKDFSYVAVFEVFPEIELTGLDKINVELPEVTIGDADVDQMIESLREQRAEWKDVARKAKKGDQVIVDFNGTLDGAPIDNGKGEDVPVVLGGGQMLPDFDKALKGTKAGEETAFDVSYPADYPAEDLAGKTAKFDAVIKNVQAQELPDVDEDFAKAFGIEDGAIAKLREEIEKNMHAELATKRRADIKQQVLDQLIEHNTVDVPQALVDQEAHSLQHDAMRRMGVTEHSDAPDRENFLPAATRRVQVGLLMQEFLKVENIELDRDRVEGKMKELFAGYEDNDELLGNYLKDPQFLQQIEPMVLEDQAIEALRAKGTESKKSVAFKAYMDAG